MENATRVALAHLRNQELGETTLGWFAQADAFLLGLRTYDIFAAHWPYVADPNDPIAGIFNKVTKYVASRSNPKLAWQNSRLLGKDVASWASPAGCPAREMNLPMLLMTATKCYERDDGYSRKPL